MQTYSYRWDLGRTEAWCLSLCTVEIISLGRGEMCKISSLHKDLMIRKLSSSRLEIRQGTEFWFTCTHCSLWPVVHGQESLNNPEKVGRSESLPLPCRNISRAR